MSTKVSLEDEDGFCLLLDNFFSVGDFLTFFLREIALNASSSDDDDEGSSSLTFKGAPRRCLNILLLCLFFFDQAEYCICFGLIVGWRLRAVTVGSEYSDCLYCSGVECEHLPDQYFACLRSHFKDDNLSLL